MKKYVYISLLLLIFFSCNKEAEIDFVAYKPKVVVEGSIEKGSFSSVLLSVSASITGPKDTLSLLGHAIKSAKVTVSDGDMSEVLMLRTNNAKIPPYEYVGTVLRGESGKTYSLKVEYSGKIITSTTTIPESVELDSVWFKKTYPQDSIGYINIKFRNTSGSYYQVSTRKYGSRNNFTPCLYGNIDSKVYPRNEEVMMQINKGPVLFPKTDYTTYFKSADTIQVRFSTQTKEAYKFWTSYQNEILNTQNPIFPANTNLMSNIEGGAIGIWTGIASNVYTIITEDTSE